MANKQSIPKNADEPKPERRAIVKKASESKAEPLVITGKAVVKPVPIRKTVGGRTRPEPMNRKLIPQDMPDKLRAIRLSFNLSQGAMLLIVNPEETKENRARISQWESGKRTPSLVEVMHYAKFAGCTMEEIVNDRLDLPSRFRNYMRTSRRRKRPNPPVE